MRWQFHKMQGAGNDFMLLDRRQQHTPELDPARIRDLADRHRGIGFDQALILEPAKRSEIVARITIWNADGSTAEQCGNGLRCVGLYLDENDQRKGAALTIAGPASDHQLQRIGPNEVSVAMGAARWEAAEIPLTGVTGAAPWTFDHAGQSVNFGALSMGNPHAVIEVDDVDRAPLTTLGRALQESPLFPHSCNVGFIQVLNRQQARLRVLERGAGETLACGSGASAAAAWMARNGRMDSQVTITMAGGVLGVESESGLGPITLTGPAQHVYLGMIE